MRKLLPVDQFNLSFREPLLVPNEPIARYCASFLPIVEAARVADGAAGNYVGIVTGGGIAMRGGKSAVSNLSPETMAHELGHNLSSSACTVRRGWGSRPLFPTPGRFDRSMGIRLRHQRTSPAIEAGHHGLLLSLRMDQRL